ncbi:MAG: hypothetical protein ACRCVA_19165 [Phreatobacter sp.]
MQDILDVIGNASPLPIRDPIARHDHAARTDPGLTKRDPRRSSGHAACRRRFAVARVPDTLSHPKGAAHV